MRVTSNARERGQVVVFFALLIPVLFGLAAVVLDVGNWYVHKRHLQTQVDAAALAAGGEFIGCFLDQPTANQDVRAEALEYAGDEGRVPTPADTRNRQVQEPADVRVVLNGTRYWRHGDPAPTYPPDPSPTADPYALDWKLDGDPVTPGVQSQPCDAKFLDVKATDVDAPGLWGLIPLTPSPKAKAKVEIRKTQSEQGLLPFAVPDLNPKTVVALWVDRAETNTVDSWTFLTGPPNPDTTVQKNGKSVALWQGESGALQAGPPPTGGQLTVVDQTGMVVLASRRELTDGDLQGKTLSDMCAIPTTFCFSDDTNTSNIQFIRGTPVSGNHPQVSLTTAELTSVPPPPNLPAGSPTPCYTTDPDSEPYFLWNGDCDIRLRAQIEFGNLAGPGNEVRINGGNNCNGGIELELRDGWWDSPWLPTIDAESGRTGYPMCWRSGSGARAPRGHFGANGQSIQMVYAAPKTQPLAYAAIRPPGCTPTLYANALAKTSQTVCVEVGLEPPLRVSGPTDPPIYVRVAGSGSLNQMVDCDDNAPSNPRGPEEEIRDGCFVPYQPNTRDLQCEPTWTRSNLPPEIPPPDPSPIPDCVEVNPGDVISMSKGLRQRFEDPPPTGAGCPPNLWDSYRMAGKLPPESDPRVVVIFVADYGTFNDSGIKPIPVVKFASIYITGWFEKDAGQMSYGCGDNDPPPTPPFCGLRRNPTACAATDSEVQGGVWGHFMSDFKFEDANPGPELCAFDQLGNCMAVLVE